jgi:hypothetical protein
LDWFILIVLISLFGPAMAGLSISSRGPGGPPGRTNPGKLALKADYILLGKITDIKYDQRGAGDIFTLATLAVERNIKGEAGREVVIRIPGGEAGGLTMMVTDTPGFRQGERALVFLKESQDFFTVCGGLYGKIPIDASDKVSGMPLDEYIAGLENTLAEKQKEA